MRIWLPLFLTLLLLGSRNLEAQQLKRVLILKFINIDQDKKYDYLEASITESVTKYLKKQYAFQGLHPDAVKDYADKNYFYQGDEYTRTYSMQLGLVLKQDIVVSGGFRIRGGKVVTTVHILDIGKKKIVEKLSFTSPTDSNIFASIEALAKKVSDAMGDILPNKEEWKRKGFKLEDEQKYVAVEVRQNQLAVMVGYSLIHMPTAVANDTVIDADTKLALNDMGPIALLNIEYQFQKVFLPELLLATGMIASIGGGDITLDTHSVSTIDTGADILMGYAGVGYDLWRWKALLFRPMLWGGYSSNRVTLNTNNTSGNTKILNGDYSASDDTNNEIDLNQDSGVIAIDLRFVFQLASGFSMRLSIRQMSFLYSDRYVGLTAAMGGVAFHF